VSDYHINVFYSEEDGGYIADIPDLEACSAFGASPEEALAEVEKAKEAWLTAARDAESRSRSPATGRRSTLDRPLTRLLRTRSNASNVTACAHGVPPPVPPREREKACLQGCSNPSRPMEDGASREN